MLEKIGSLTFTYLLGIGLLCFGWACYRERPPVEQIARPIVIFFACTVAVMFALGLIARPCASPPVNYQSSGTAYWRKMGSPLTTVAFSTRATATRRRSNGSRCTIGSP